MLKVGMQCETPDGPGKVVGIERFGNKADAYRVGVKHDTYPKHRVQGMFDGDVLYYFPKEVVGSTIFSLSHAPLSNREVTMLRTYAANLKQTAERKGTTLDAWEEQRESQAAEQHFELGCWLYYYSRRVGSSEAEGLQHRIDCARRLFLAGFNNPGYRFFTVFDFGERQFDTIMEMGDSKQVIAALRDFARQDQSGQIARAFDYFGWPLEEPVKQQ